MDFDVAQQAVVEHDTGPALLAGSPGSGKIRALEGRISQLIKWGLPPEQLLVVTFTRAATAEMTRRLAKNGHSGVEVRTFHSLAMNKCQQLGLFEKLRMDDLNAMYYQRRKAVQTMKRVGTLGRQELVDAGAVDIFISRCKATGYVPVEGNIFGRNEEGEEHVRQTGQKLIDEKLEGFVRDTFSCVQIYREIEQRRSALGVYDYDDLQNWFWQAIMASESWLRWFQKSYRSVLVDEGQDCSPIQHDIALLSVGLGSRIDPRVKAWDKRDHSVMIASDSSQSLYSWRSASPENLLAFSNEKGVKTFILPFNYRSRPEICKLGTGLVEGKVWHLTGEMQAVRKADSGPSKIEFKQFKSRQDELRWAIDRAKNNLGNVAVLSRTSAILHYGELICIREDIPYEKRGGQFLLDSRESRDLLAYVQVAAGLDDADGTALRRVINAPFRYVSKAAMNFCQERKGRNQTLLDALLGYNELKYPVKRGLLVLKDLLADLTALAPAGPVRIIEEAVRRTKYLEWLAGEVGMSTDEDDVASMMIDEILNVADGFKDASELLAFVEGMRSAKRRQQGLVGDGKAKVVLSTVHGVKGEEYEEVIICDMVEDRFPSKQAKKSQARLEEELRILYVAVTRAKERLFLSWSRPSRVSRFVGQLQQIQASGTEEK